MFFSLFAQMINCAQLDDTLLTHLLLTDDASSHSLSLSPPPPPPSPLTPPRRALLSSFVYGLTYGFSQSIIFFLYAIVFRFGAFQVTREPGHVAHLEFQDLFRVFLALVFGALTVGQAGAFAPNYAKAKVSANRIFALLDRMPEIDSYSEDGSKLVSVSVMHVPM